MVSLLLLKTEGKLVIKTVFDNTCIKIFPRTIIKRGDPSTRVSPL